MIFDGFYNWTHQGLGTQLDTPGAGYSNSVIVTTYFINVEPCHRCLSFAYSKVRRSLIKKHSGTVVIVYVYSIEQPIRERVTDCTKIIVDLSIHKF